MDDSRPEDRLESWKEIATYLGRDARTVQRWEKLESLPVHRLQHSKRGSVYAYRRELDAWRDNRRVGFDESAAMAPDAAVSSANGLVEAPLPPARPSRWIRAVLVLAVGAALAGAVAYVFQLRSSLEATPFAEAPGNEDMPSFSPDGQAVAFVWDGPSQDNMDIYIRPIASAPVRQFTTSPLDDFSPAWSPDGGSIAFLRKPKNGVLVSLFIAPANGGPERKILDIPDFRFLPIATLAWSGDGKWLIGPARETKDEPMGLFLIAAADGKKIRLTRPPPDQADIEPALAPDGRTLAFLRSHSESVSSIYLMPLSRDLLAAGEPQAIPTFNNLRISSPQWLPNGKDLLFAANPKSGMAIWRIRIPADGAAPEPPRPEPYAERSFGMSIGRPSAPARRLMFATQIQDRNLWRATLGGSLRLQRVGAPGQRNSGARISPDASRIAFQSMRTGATEIWVSRTDGSNPRQLTHFGGPVTGSPAWSPDGAWITFDSRAEGRPHLYTIPADGGQPRRITAALADNYLPSWSHDGQWIYFASSRSGSVEVWRQPASSGEAVQLTRGGGWAPAESPDGTALYYQRRVPAGWALRRLTLATGEDIEILPALTERTFGVARDGIYYVPLPAADGSYSIQFQDFRTGASRLVTPITRPMSSAIEVAPDGSFLLYSQLDRWGRRLMLVENFR